VSGRARPDATVAVLDPSEAGTVYGRGFFGTPGGEGLMLDRPEGVYLSEMARLEVTDERGRGLPWTELFRRAVRVEPGFPIRYLVYRDLRQRGYVVRESPPPARFAVLPRGGILHKTPARFWVQPISEREPFDLAELLALSERALAARKTLLLGVVDEESDLTYYRVGRSTPSGTRAFAAPPTPALAFVTEDRVQVLDAEAVPRLGHEQGFGSRVGSRLELSLVEAAFLAEHGAIVLRAATTHRPLDLEAYRRRAGRVDPAFATRLAAYTALRGRGLVVKTGFKYGAHFRAYVRDPDQTHARYLIEAVPTAWKAPWPAVAGQVRLAQGVRKEFLLAAVAEDRSVRCISLERIRP
jgi:tRNA-intron endonuclease